MSEPKGASRAVDVLEFLGLAAALGMAVTARCLGLGDSGHGIGPNDLLHLVGVLAMACGLLLGAMRDKLTGGRLRVSSLLGLVVTGYWVVFEVLEIPPLPWPVRYSLRPVAEFLLHAGAAIVVGRKALPPGWGRPA
jgi:hypothetical protein